MNPYPVELAFQLYPLTDGAASEDLLGQLGIIVKAKRELFLNMLHKYNIENKHLVDSMESRYPIDEFVDDLDKRIERIESPKKVKQPRLIDLRNQCLDILARDLAHYQRIKADRE